MVVGCPKCKIKLKVADEKLTPEGIRFKCPKCSAVLLVKKPDDYIEEHHVEDLLMEKIEALQPFTEMPPKTEAQRPQAATPSSPEIKPEIKKEIKTEADEAVEKAKRLARTIIADIYLYSSTKMEEAIKKNAFYTEFASDIKEGTKLYNDRVSQEVKNKGDFFREAIENFIENKKKTIKI